ncbi:uncharacterized protein LOC123509530 isoform X2 [Portunus trituberculatus]|uniref:uncharacterized protein LOC123509530 isoform X2 n=1 Tax=Portunus trituberculatus TaxID=210409 RepID=UPI001E1D0387|nr:uncharacterized protein LOC123509530 isoform X2 [Portunus trituberculatus]
MKRLSALLMYECRLQITTTTTIAIFIFRSVVSRCAAFGRDFKRTITTQHTSCWIFAYSLIAESAYRLNCAVLWHQRIFDLLHREVKEATAMDECEGQELLSWDLYFHHKASAVSRGGGRLGAAAVIDLWFEGGAGQRLLPPIQQQCGRSDMTRFICMDSPGSSSAD